MILWFLLLLIMFLFGVWVGMNIANAKIEKILKDRDRK